MKELYQWIVKGVRIFINEVYLWLDFLVAGIPGHAGVLARRVWFNRRFNCPSNITIGNSVTFSSPRNIEFGDCLAIGDHSFFSADGGRIRIGSGTAFNRGVHINASVCGEIQIGKKCLFGPNVVVRTANHNFSDPEKYIQDQGHEFGNIIIEDDVWIGANAVILPGVRIGRGAVIGAGSIVVVDIPHMAIAVGVPAKAIKYRDGGRIKD